MPVSHKDLSRRRHCFLGSKQKANLHRLAFLFLIHYSFPDLPQTGAIQLRQACSTPVYHQ